MDKDILRLKDELAQAKAKIFDLESKLKELQDSVFEAKMREASKRYSEGPLEKREFLKAETEKNETLLWKIDNLQEKVEW